MAKYMKTEQGYIDIPSFVLAPFKPAGKSYLTFSSLNNFTLAVNDATKHWNGTLEYFASDKTWTTWDGTTTLSAVYNGSEYVLYLRGTVNTVITGSSNTNYKWVLTGTDIKCIGNIENLLDYRIVELGGHPTLSPSCYSYMFQGCSALTQAPSLSATKLANNCYEGMFQGCTSLKLSSTRTDEYTQEYRIPSSGNGVTAANALYNMFSSTGGTFTGTPDINTKYYLSSDNMIVRETDISTLNGYVGSMINNAVPTALSDLSDDETHRTVTDEEKTAWSAKSDWNQNDNTAADYVKNRPFYTGDTVESDPIDFISATWRLDNGVYSAEYTGTGNFPLVVGNRAKLIVDGKEYTGTVGDYSALSEGMIGFGDLEALLANDITAFNFCVYGAQNEDIVYLLVAVKADAEPTSCAVFGIMQEVKKIEPKYLPGSLLPDSASSGQMMKFKGYSWLPVPDPTEWEFIYGKSIVGGSTEIPCKIEKAYKKILVVAKGIKVSGTNALDIYASTLPKPVANYKISGFCKIPLAAQPALEKSTTSFLIIEKLPFQGHLCFVNKTPYSEVDSPQDSDVLMTYNRRPKLVSQGVTGSTTLYFGITGDTLDGAGSLTLYGIPE